MKALSSSPLWQGVQVSSTFLNEEFKNGAKGLPYVYHRASSGWHRTGHICQRSRVQVFSAVGVVYDQSQTDVVSQGPKRRGRPKKKATEDDQAPKLQAYHSEENQQELPSVTQTRGGHLFKYKDVVPEVLFQQFDDEKMVSAAVVKYIAQVSKDSINSRGWFTIALSGGSLVKVLKKVVDEPGIDWTKWHVFWVDERVVPLTDNDSNFKLAMGIFLSKGKIPKDQIHSIKYTEDASMVSKRYDRLMRDLAKRKVLSLDFPGAFPCFDMILLGIGTDGHVASLFPNSLALAEEKEWVVAVLNSPKPPPQRISMTLPCINAASHVAFVVVGSSKAEVLQRVLERPALPGSLPAQMVRPLNGVLNWFVDKEAASNLSVDAWGDPKQFPAVNFNAPKKMQ